VKQAAKNGAQCYLAKYPHPSVLKRVIEEAERASRSGASAAQEWFGLSANLLLRWGLGSARVAGAVESRAENGSLAGNRNPAEPLGRTRPGAQSATNSMARE
jgi:hypothetical protein